MVRLVFGSEFECETFLGEQNAVLNIKKWTQSKF